MTDILVPLFPGIPGGPEMLIVLLIIVLLFGANKLPKLARSTGQAMGEFRRGRDELENEIKEGAAADDASTDDDVEADAETDDPDRTTTA
ncbi:sec-independent protein translocase protein TatA [Halopelagius inordinatus]|uniref:Sec-independent protein translocase protein TatA n=1 Tax=Halopelagius inordinatus TaxID=553467 RepID=A0A1I2NCC3_9EURY|nr:twin-arginine translocase TatA/TatE family subunit [Halopelagius inordinatus]SFG01575.1 sec-independent protein translocase protein TatA [Halopelagius inordinatus]